MTSSELAVLLEGQSFRVGTEEALQAGIEDFLRNEMIPFAREFRFSAKDRVDFLVGLEGEDQIACEVKIHGGLSDVTRQLHRYAQHPAVTSLVLVTSRMQLVRVPRELNGKPVSVAALLGGL